MHKAAFFPFGISRVKGLTYGQYGWLWETFTLLLVLYCLLYCVQFVARPCKRNIHRLQAVSLVQQLNNSFHNTEVPKVYQKWRKTL